LKFVILISEHIRQQHEMCLPFYGWAFYYLFKLCVKTMLSTASQGENQAADVAAVTTVTTSTNQPTSQPSK